MKKFNNIQKNQNFKSIGMIFLLIVLIFGFALLINKDEVSNNNVLIENNQADIIDKINFNISIEELPEYSGQIYRHK